MISHIFSDLLKQVNVSQDNQQYKIRGADTVK